MGNRKSSPRLATTSVEMLLPTVSPMSHGIYLRFEKIRLWRFLLKYDRIMKKNTYMVDDYESNFWKFQR
ncbi:hypothetical protein RKD55_002564 [Rossellomorea marisflavi]